MPALVSFHNHVKIQPQNVLATTSLLTCATSLDRDVCLLTKPLTRSRAQVLEGLAQMLVDGEQEVPRESGYIVVRFSVVFLDYGTLPSL